MNVWMIDGGGQLCYHLFSFFGAENLVTRGIQTQIVGVEAKGAGH